MRRILLPLVLAVLAGCSTETVSTFPVTLPPQTDQSSTTTATPTSPVTPTGGGTTTAPATAAPPTTLPPLQALAYEPVAEAPFPIFLMARPGAETGLLAERGGLIRTFSADGLGDVMLDLSDTTTTSSERGLLGLALHPEDTTRLFVHYTDGGGDTVVSEFAVDGSAADRQSESVLLTVDQPAGNHNGGMIQFGPDGALYLGLGDGGGSGDQFGNAQNPDTLLGGVVRIDPDTAESELWQLGLRNPWRFWIDGSDIWIGDVGQNAYEEIDLADVTTQGLNYGWPVTEAAHCYQADECDRSGFVEPLVEVVRGDAGSCSITGGVVYRGLAIPELTGRFLFSDYCGGYLRSVDSAGEVVDHTPDVGEAGQVVSFGVDGNGEVYVLTVDQVLRLVAVR